MKKLLVFVYSNGTDCTNGGLTSKYSRLPLYFGPLKVEELRNLEDKNVLVLKKRSFSFRADADIAIPLEFFLKELDGDRSLGNTMFGGNFVFTCDSRFPKERPIAVHDREEKW
jgi:hypothetical protein